mgnify:CR=1 FL=1
MKKQARPPTTNKPNSFHLILSQVNIYVIFRTKECCMWDDTEAVTSIFTSICSFIITVGLYLDMWDHTNLQVESFFRFSHYVFYTGIGLTTVLLVSLWLLDKHRTKSFKFSLIGLTVFFLGVVGDSTWHIFWGFEDGIAGLISPTHSLMFLGWSILSLSPILAFWQQSKNLSLLRTGLVVAAVALGVACLKYILLYTHPLYHTSFNYFGLSSTVLHTAFLAITLIPLFNNFNLPFGSTPLILILSEIGVIWLLDAYWFLPLAFLTGCLIDTYRETQYSSSLITAGLVGLFYPASFILSASFFTPGSWPILPGIVTVLLSATTTLFTIICLFNPLPNDLTVSKKSAVFLTLVILNLSLVVLHPLSDSPEKFDFETDENFGVTNLILYSILMASPLIWLVQGKPRTGEIFLLVFLGLLSHAIYFRSFVLGCVTLVSAIGIETVQPVKYVFKDERGKTIYIVISQLLLWPPLLLYSFYVHDTVWTHYIWSGGILLIAMITAGITHVSNAVRRL